MQDYAEGEILHEELWTRDSWTKWVREYIQHEHAYRNEPDVNEMIADTNFIEYLALCILQTADWQDLSTLLVEIDVYENWIEWKNK